MSAFVALKQTYFWGNFAGVKDFLPIHLGCKMANKEQLAILKQGVAAWNKWREENPDADIDLRWAKLDGQNLSGANFSKADIRGASFRNAILVMVNFREALLDDIKYIGSKFNFATNFSGSDLTNAIFNKAYIGNSRFYCAILTGSSFLNINELNWHYDRKDYETIFGDSIVRKILKRKNLKGAILVTFDLRGLDLREIDFRQANLSRADITGTKLYNTARENWIIDGIRCDYVYWDEAGEQRTPPDRDFRPGEFEELHKQLPTFEYIFEQGFTPLDPLIMDRVVQAINERNKEFSLELVSFDKRGQPHATFTVCHLEHVEKAKQQIAAGYEENRIAPERQEQLMAAVLGLIENQSKLIDKIPSSRGLAMGDNYYISGGQIGAVGQSASASGNTFQQITADLSLLHEEMQRSAKTPEQRTAAENVAKAAQAASEQNESAMLQHLKNLKNVGKFALDCAKTIGTDVAAECLKKAMGM